MLHRSELPHGETVVVLGALRADGQAIPLCSSLVPAGFPSPAQDHLEQQISLDELMNIRAPQTYLAQACGDSMTGIGLYDRDLMVVDRSLDAVSRDIVIALVNGDVCVKRYCRENGSVILRPENAAFPPRYIMEGDELQVWGVVTGWIRRTRHA